MKDIIVAISSCALSILTIYSARWVSKDQKYISSFSGGLITTCVILSYTNVFTTYLDCIFMMIGMYIMYCIQLYVRCKENYSTIALWTNIFYNSIYAFITGISYNIYVFSSDHYWIEYLVHCLKVLQIQQHL